MHVHNSLWRYSMWRYSLWRYSMWRYSLWRYSLWRYSMWRYSLWRYSMWRYSLWRYSMWRYSLWRYSKLLTNKAVKTVARSLGLHIQPHYRQNSPSKPSPSTPHNVYFSFLLSPSVVSSVFFWDAICCCFLRSNKARVADVNHIVYNIKIEKNKPNRQNHLIPADKFAKR